MRWTIGLVAAVALAAGAGAAKAQVNCPAGSARKFEAAATPYKIARLADSAAVPRDKQLVISTTSAEGLTCGRSDAGPGCRIAGPAMVKLQRDNDIAYFDIPAGRIAAVLGSTPLRCELD